MRRPVSKGDATVKQPRPLSKPPLPVQILGLPRRRRSNPLDKSAARTEQLGWGRGGNGRHSGCRGEPPNRESLPPHSSAMAVRRY
jgi:hypothetical protein